MKAHATQFVAARDLFHMVGDSEKDPSDSSPEVQTGPSCLRVARYQARDGSKFPHQSGAFEVDYRLFLR